MSTKTNEELAETFTQFAQKCTICAEWLFDGETTTDPSHPWQIVHKDCIYTSDIDQSTDTEANITTDAKKRECVEFDVSLIPKKKQKK
jgi:hypothetical protein